MVLLIRPGHEGFLSDDRRRAVGLGALAARFARLSDLFSRASDLHSIQSLVNTMILFCLC